jgi:hypothetical protein
MYVCMSVGCMSVDMIFYGLYRTLVLWSPYIPYIPYRDPLYGTVYRGPIYVGPIPGPVCRTRCRTRKL